MVKIRDGISVVIPFRTREERLLRLLCQLHGIGQQFRHAFEVIVVDDAAPVSALEAIRNADFGCVTVVRNTENLGRGASRNRGARVAVCDKLLFIDADDLPGEDYVSHVYECLDSAPQKTICRTNFRIAPDSFRNRGLAKFFDSRQYGYLFERDGLSRTDVPFKYLASGALAIRAVDFHALGGFTEDLTGYGGEDEEFGLRASREGYSLQFCPEAVIYDGNWETSLRVVRSKMVPYVREGLKQIVKKCPEYCQRSMYARLAYGRDIKARLLRRTLILLEGLGLGTMGTLIVDRLPDCPPWVYALLIAMKVAYAAK